MNLAAKDIRDVNDLFSAAVEDSSGNLDVFVSKRKPMAHDKARVHQSLLAPLLPEQQAQSAEHVTCSDIMCTTHREQDTSLDEEWMKRYEATMDDILVSCFGFFVI